MKKFTQINESLDPSISFDAGTDVTVNLVLDASDSNDIIGVVFAELAERHGREKAIEIINETGKEKIVSMAVEEYLLFSNEDIAGSLGEHIVIHLGNGSVETIIDLIELK